MSVEIRKGSFLAKRTGALAWWRSRGEPPIVLCTDPPYTMVSASATTKRRGLRVPGSHGRGGVAGQVFREISYGRLTDRVREGIAAIAAVALWSAIYDRFEGMGEWRRAVIEAGGVWLGTGSVLQRNAAPRLRGDGPAIHFLGLGMARRPGKTRWRGRPWADYVEARPVASVDRPIPGTRSIWTIADILTDLAASCDERPIVIDPCAGTGVVLQAAKSLNLEAVGWERDSKTYAYARDVISGHGIDIPGQVRMF